jgi:hypothetical protein
MAFPTVNLLDDFTRAANASLGANWTEAVNGKTNRAEINGSNAVSVTGVGTSSMAAYSGTNAIAGSQVAFAEKVNFSSNTVADAHGIGVTQVTDTTKGYHVEFDNQGTDVISHIVNDVTAVELAVVTATGYGKIITGERIGITAKDTGTTCVLEIYHERAGVWTMIATNTPSGAQYIPGPYYGSLRVKYDVESIDNFAGGFLAAVPSSPQSLGATSGDSQVVLNWSAPASDGGSAVLRYNIYRSLSTGAEALYVSPAGTSTTYVDGTTVNGTNYFYQVTAVNAIGESVRSGEVSAIPSAPAAAAPATLTLKRFYGPAQLGNTAALLYTCPASTVAVVRHVHVSNPSGAPVNFSLAIGSNTADKRLWDATPIPASDLLDHYQDFTLIEGEILQGFAGSAATLNLTIDGYEEGAGTPAATPIYPSDTLFPSETAP